VTSAQSPYFGKIWLVTLYEDVLECLKNPMLSSDMKSSGMRSGWIDAWWVPKVFKTIQKSMVTTDEPDHRRLRDLVHQAFTPRIVEKMTGRIEQITDKLLDLAEHRRKIDLIADFALPLPLTVISEMMGVPERDRLKFHKWSAKFLEVGAGDPKVLFKQIPNGIRMLRFFERLIALRKTNPGEDLITGLVQAKTEGDRLNQDELLSMIFLLLLAGHETTVNLIGNGVLALLENPDQYQKLHNNPEIIDSAIEELLRYSNPVEYGNMRYALEDIEIRGQIIPKGSIVLLLLASANRDCKVFENPDQLDLTRTPNRHLGFGFGVHYCLGAPLARLEGRIAISKLVQRFPNMKLAVSPEQLKWRTTIAVRGLKDLPLQLS